MVAFLWRVVYLTPSLRFPKAPGLKFQPQSPPSRSWVSPQFVFGFMEPILLPFLFGGWVRFCEVAPRGLGAPGPHDHRSRFLVLIQICSFVKDVVNHQ